MFSHLKTALATVTLGAAALLAQPAFAATVYQSATYTGDDTGEYIIQNGRSIGAAFSLSEATNITAIGAQFGGFPGGTIFGAIVSLSDLKAFPAGDPSNLDAIDLAHTVFSVPTIAAIDLSTPLSVTLAAGDYAVIFGSGQFGATGFAGLGYLNDTVGSPELFQTLFSNEWMDQSDHGIRIFVEGTPAATAAVPEPATWALLVLGFGVMGATLRRRAYTVSMA